jgi:phenylacetate-coenzyme A ligase PaaK-like adenylate-forming protein
MGAYAISRNERGSAIMPRVPLRVKLRALLASNVVFANRVLWLLGQDRLQKISQRNAIRAAQRAYDTVQYYRTLYQDAGFDHTRMRRLDWNGFLSLPTASKAATAETVDEDLLDRHLSMPRDDALVGRSSGTTRKPVAWPMGWDEFYLTRAAFRAGLRELQADRKSTAVVLIMGAEGTELAGNLMYRIFFSLKEETRWPFEVFLTGEDPTDVCALMKWLARRKYHSILLCSFPGIFEIALGALDADPEARDIWTQFARKKIYLGGQIVTRRLRRYIWSQMALAPDRLLDLDVLYISSDTGQTIAHTTPFVAWLQRHADERPELYSALGLAEEHRMKSLLEFVPSISLFVEPNAGGIQGALLTTSKHRPLVRYESHDLVWTKSSTDVVRLLDQSARGWRRDFKKYGYGRRFIPTATLIGAVLGRTDDIRIVNGANISPDVLSRALELAQILPHVHHFKHDTNDDAPSAYYVYLELPDQADATQLRQLEDTWRPKLLNALTSLPETGSVLLSPVKSNLDLHLFVRSRGADEFSGDDARRKLVFVPVRN